MGNNDFLLTLVPSGEVGDFHPSLHFFEKNLPYTPYFVQFLAGQILREKSFKKAVFDFTPKRQHQCTTFSSLLTQTFM